MNFLTLSHTEDYIDCLPTFYSLNECTDFPFIVKKQTNKQTKPHACVDTFYNSPQVFQKAATVHDT